MDDKNEERGKVIPFPIPEEMKGAKFVDKEYIRADIVEKLLNEAVQRIIAAIAFINK